MSIYEVKIDANGLEFSALSSWPQSQLGKSAPSELLLLLHGFPDTKSTWRPIWPHLQAAFPKALIVAPAMRGYEPSTVLDDSAYTQDAIASDIVVWMDLLSLGANVHIIGHDWGAVATYKVAHLRPELLTSMTTLAIPYSIVENSVAAMWRHPRQLWLSSYMLTMQIPFLYRGRFSDPQNLYLKRLWKYWSPGWAFSKDDLHEVSQIFQQPGVTDSTTAYYRRLLQRVPKRGEFDVDFRKTPALILGGVQDGCMGAELFQGDSTRISAAQVRVVDGVGHFMHREDPEKLARIIADFIVSKTSSALQPLRKTKRSHI